MMDIDKMDMDKVKFVGLLKDKTENGENTYNGVISFNLNSLLIEENSRITGKLKNSYELPFLDICDDDIERKAFNKLCIETKEHFLTLKVTDKIMLDDFEEILRYKITGKLKEGDVFVSTTTEEIRKYHALYEEGIITEEEFKAKKKQLLGL